MNIYGTIATEIVNDEFDYLTGSEETSQVAVVSGWLSGHLGDLNVYIHTQFSGEEPELCIEESAIFKQLYLLSYYRKKMNDTLRGIDDSVAWITLKEGDSVITKTNKNEVAKTWRGLMNDTKNELKTLADKYLIYSAAPVQVLEID